MSESIESVFNGRVSLNALSGSFGFLGKNPKTTARKIAREMDVDYLPVSTEAGSDYLVIEEDFKNALESHLQNIRAAKRKAANRNAEKRKKIQAIAKREGVAYAKAKEIFEKKS
jgi:pyruvate/2-oxoglutarate dehydrogenase complex dihydrolipoamide acyltransferase (E2) component